MNRSWVRFPQAAQIRPPGSGWAFLYARVVLRCCLWPPRVFRAPEGPSVGPGCLVRPWAAARPRDRHTRACGSEWSISKPGQAPPPPTSAAARPSGPSGALHTSGARSLMFSSARWLEARPGPAAAHGHRSQAHQSLRRPPHQWRLVADVWLGASSQGPPWPCHRPSISHVIPLRLVQTLNLHRWNCNVFVRS